MKLSRTPKSRAVNFTQDPRSGLWPSGPCAPSPCAERGRSGQADQPARRRIVSLALLLLAGSLLYLAERIYEISLRDGTYLTGWILFVMTLLLALLNVRKRLSVLPLLPAAVWFQTHVYVGILAFGLFFLHSNFRLPNGPFEKALWWASVLAFATGILGLLLSRVLPGRLKRHR